MPESKNRYTKTYKKRTLLSKRLRHCVVTGTVLGALDFILFMADFIVAGHFLGKDALAGLTLANPMITFLTFSNIILPAGTAAAIAYLRGRGDKDRANGLFSQGLILTVVLGLLFSVVLFIGAFFFKDTSVSDNIDIHTSRYFTGLIPMPVFMFLNTLFYYIHVGEGFENVCIISSAVKLVVNITLNIVLCVFWGTLGIGIATTIGYLASLMVKAVPVIRRKLSLRFRAFFSLGELIKTAGLGITLSADYICPVLFSTLMNLSILFFFGESILAIFSIVLNIENLFLSISSCIGNSVQADLCHAYSEKNLKNIRAVMKYVLRYITVLLILLTAGLMIFADFIPGLFGLKDGNAAMECAAAIRCYAPFILFLGLNIVLSRYYVCIHHKLYGFTLITLSTVVIPFILQLVLGMVAGSPGIWLGLGAGYPMAFLLNLLLARSLGRRQHVVADPMLLFDVAAEKRQISYNLRSEQEEIMACVYDIDYRLKAMDGLSDVRRGKLVLMTEENCMKIREQNPGKPADIEISIIVPEDVGEPFNLNIRTDRNLTDPTDETIALRSLRDYLVSSVMLSSEDNFFVSNKMMTTLSFTY